MTTVTPRIAVGQISCSRPELLPAYAHNDYENSRPLHHALALGYRGVEADLVLREGELRVAHSGADSRPGRTLEAIYLRPLRAILQQCGRVLDSSTALLLNLELKERSRAAYDVLLAILVRYRDLLEQGTSRTVPPVEIILVGWGPPADEVKMAFEKRLGRQFKIATPTDASAPDFDSVRLISLDYGKTIGWSGRGPVPQSAAAWLSRVRRVKGEGFRQLARAYNAPVNAAVYRLLLEGGIDLIGTEDLEATAGVLRHSTR